MYRMDGDFRAENIPTSEGFTTATVRHPSDEEWTRRQKARRLVYKIGRRRDAEPEIPGGSEADLELYNAIRSDGAPELDPDEAALAINTLFWCDCEADDIDPGPPMRIPMDTAQGEVTHVLRMPTAKQIRTCRDASRVMKTKGRRIEIQANPGPPAELYDQLSEDPEGYEGPVPIEHKAAAVGAVFEFIEGLGIRPLP